MAGLIFVKDLLLCDIESVVPKLFFSTRLLCFTRKSSHSLLNCSLFVESEVRSMNCSSLDVLKSAGAVHHIFLSLAWNEVSLAMKIFCFAFAWEPPHSTEWCHWLAIGGMQSTNVTFLDRLCSLGIPTDSKKVPGIRNYYPMENPKNRVKPSGAK